MTTLKLPLSQMLGRLEKVQEYARQHPHMLASMSLPMQWKGDWPGSERP
jgi:hypothetical protein